MQQLENIYSEFAILQDYSIDKTMIKLSWILIRLKLSINQMIALLLNSYLQINKGSI